MIRWSTSLIVIILILTRVVLITCLECEEPLQKHYCVTKGHNPRELPPGEPPLTIMMEIGVSVR